MAEHTCSIDGCSNRSRRRGWCGAHHQRWLRHGDPHVGGPIVPNPPGRSPEERFWAKVDRRGPDECWPWTAGVLTDGYGSFRHEGRSWPAHRWLWVQMHGPIPDGLVVRHTCDNPPCVNPAHHLIGTVADNKRDEVERNRNAYGSRNGWAKLREADVVQIKRRLRAGDRRDDIAADFNVCKATISHIANGRSWKHVHIE